MRQTCFEWFTNNTVASDDSATNAIEDEAPDTLTVPIEGSVLRRTGANKQSLATQCARCRGLCLVPSAEDECVAADDEVAWTPISSTRSVSLCRGKTMYYMRPTRLDELGGVAKHLSSDRVEAWHMYYEHVRALRVAK